MSSEPSTSRSRRWPVLTLVGGLLLLVSGVAVGLAAREIPLPGPSGFSIDQFETLSGPGAEVRFVGGHLSEDCELTLEMIVIEDLDPKTLSTMIIAPGDVPRASCDVRAGLAVLKPEASTAGTKPRITLVGSHGMGSLSGWGSGWEVPIEPMGTSSSIPAEPFFIPAGESRLLTQLFFTTEEGMSGVNEPTLEETLRRLNAKTDHPQSKYGVVLQATVSKIEDSKTKSNSPLSGSGLINTEAES
ncbi:hypothetical protein [Stratiformator vulcanicus]|uniref:Uncharacterized protein n=1 Tax=Stratiformator vulcanicus TaxID=2527980 RepID=A0A517QVW8_9PLAN|nr:hypothetical protein [Stratiformator vulcanicus]QDT35796.1 hypothetical protein Pan189_01490 [Stratiformator vulcanicus]